MSFLSTSTNFVLKLCGIDPTETEEPVSEEEIRMLVDAGSEKGAIQHQEKEFIQNVFEFNDIMVGSIATHRTDTAILWTEDCIDDWDETIHNTRHTLYPVCENSADHVIGILNAKDYFRPVSYTHLDVYKRQDKRAPYGFAELLDDTLFNDTVFFQLLFILFRHHFCNSPLCTDSVFSSASFFTKASSSRTRSSSTWILLAL